MYLFTGEPLDNSWRAWWQTNSTIWVQFDCNYFMLASISDYFATVFHPPTHTLTPNTFNYVDYSMTIAIWHLKLLSNRYKFPSSYLQFVAIFMMDSFLSSMLNLFCIFMIPSVETLGYWLSLYYHWMLYALPVWCKSGFYGRPKLFSLLKILFSFPLIIFWVLITTRPAHRKHLTDAYSPQSDSRVLYLREFADCTRHCFDLARVHTVRAVRFNLFTPNSLMADMSQFHVLILIFEFRVFFSLLLNRSKICRFGFRTFWF